MEFAYVSDVYLTSIKCSFHKSYFCKNKKTVPIKNGFDTVNL